jgi:hypothetical protein
MKATLVLLVALVTLCALALLSDGLAIGDEEPRPRQRPQELRQRQRPQEPRTRPRGPQRQQQMQQQHHQQGNRRRASTRSPGQSRRGNGKVPRPARRTRRPNARNSTPKP